MAEGTPPPSGGKTINLPGVGKVKKTTAGVVAAVVLVLGIMWYRNRSSSSVNSATGTATVTDPAGNVCAVVNPATGYCPGTPADIGAQGPGLNNALGGGGGIIGYDQRGNPIYGNTTGTQVQNGPPFSTNAAWSQYAITTLEGNGYDAATVTAALGAYISGSLVTEAQHVIINAAIAVANYPPSAGANGFPPAINVAGSQGGTVTIPDLKGKHAGDAHNALAALGLHPSAPAGQKASEIVTGTQPAAGAKVQVGTFVVINAAAAPAGSGMVTIPNEAGKSAGQAHNALVAAGLVPVAPPAQRANMKVSHTNPAAGSTVPRGTRVTIATSGYVN